LRGARWRSLRARGGLFRLRRGQPAPADATLLYGFMLELLRRRGYQKPAWFTPGEFASSLPDRELAALVARFTRSYNEMRFGRQVERAPTLASLLDQLRAFPG
ncbi:MAG: DUF4129 domain-containing protein, partial [Acidobacteria bacterium]|nr:DUF4129 domain-containing protein [Acidobacteriota bacterium]